MLQIAYLAVGNLLGHRKGGANISNKDKFKTIRLTKEELESIVLKAKEAGLSTSEYLRACVSGGLMDNPKFRRDVSELTYEVHKIGVNVNQIAYSNNTGVMTAQEKEVLLELLNDIQKGLLKVIKYGNH